MVEKYKIKGENIFTYKSQNSSIFSIMVRVIGVLLSLFCGGILIFLKTNSFIITIITSTFLFLFIFFYIVHLGTAIKKLLYNNNQFIMIFDITHTNIVVNLFSLLFILFVFSF